MLLPFTSSLAALDESLTPSPRLDVVVPRAAGRHVAPFGEDERFTLAAPDVSPRSGCSPRHPHHSLHHHHHPHRRRRRQNTTERRVAAQAPLARVPPGDPRASYWRMADFEHDYADDDAGGEVGSNDVSCSSFIS